MVCKVLHKEEMFLQIFAQSKKRMKRFTLRKMVERWKSLRMRRNSVKIYVN